MIHRIVIKVNACELGIEFCVYNCEALILGGYVSEHISNSTLVFNVYWLL